MVLWCYGAINFFAIVWMFRYNLLTFTFGEVTFARKYNEKY